MIKEGVYLTDRAICRDEHSRQLRVWLIAFDEFSSQV
jgi:hypothetical protein